MDHGDHGNDGGDDHTGHQCPMIMSFHFGTCETILFSGWTVHTAGPMAGSAIAIFLITILYEGLKYYREKLYADYTNLPTNIPPKLSSSNLTEVSNMPRKTILQQITSKIHLIQTVLHLIQVAISYAIMLIVMTFNLWLVFAVLLGAAFGYFFFGWLRQRSLDVAEHCQ